MGQKIKASQKKKPPAAAKPTAPEHRLKLLSLPAPYIALGLVALHLLLVAAVFNPTIFTGGDNGVYVALSRSLVEQGAYLSIHDPVATPHTYYPPGYPTILAIASLLGIQPWVHIKLVTVAFSAAGVALAYLWLRRRTTAGIALFAALVTAISPGLLVMSHYELSDVPFWALAMLALWLMEAVPREARGRVVVAALAAAAAYLTRTAALPMVVAMIGWLVLEKRWKQLAILVAIVTPAMGWWYWWTHTHTAGNVYGNQFWYLDVYAPELGRASFTDLLKRIPENTKAYGGIMLPLLFRGQPGPFIFGLALLLLAIAGWALRLRGGGGGGGGGTGLRRFGLSEIFFPLYGGMLFLCPPPWAGERYMLPLIPLALTYAAEAVLWPIRRRRAALALSVGAIATLAFVLLAGPAIVQRARAASECRSAFRAGQPYGCLDPEWQDYLSLADWSRSGLPKHAVVISRKPGLFFALSDRRGVDIPKTERPEEFFRIATEANARYLVLDRTDALTGYYAVPVVANYINSFCLVHAGFTQGTAVLGILLERPLAATAPGQQPTLTLCPPAFAASNAR
ncbi:MAG: ArnT family glycosyltransferase [Gemmatimonadota bacterium]